MHDSEQHLYVRVACSNAEQTSQIKMSFVSEFLRQTKGKYGCCEKDNMHLDAPFIAKFVVFLDFTAFPTAHEHTILAHRSARAYSCITMQQ